MRSLCMSVLSAQTGQKRMLDPPKLELQAIVSQEMWQAGNWTWGVNSSKGRSRQAFNCWALSPATTCRFFFFFLLIKEPFQSRWCQLVLLCFGDCIMGIFLFLKTNYNTYFTIFWSFFFKPITVFFKGSYYKWCELHHFKWLCMVVYYLVLPLHATVTFKKCFMCAWMSVYMCTCVCVYVCICVFSWR